MTFSAHEKKEGGRCPGHPVNLLVDVGIQSKIVLEDNCELGGEEHPIKEFHRRWPRTSTCPCTPLPLSPILTRVNFSAAVELSALHVVNIFSGFLSSSETWSAAHIFNDSVAPGRPRSFQVFSNIQYINYIWSPREKEFPDII